MVRASANGHLLYGNHSTIVKGISECQIYDHANDNDSDYGVYGDDKSGEKRQIKKLNVFLSLFIL